MTVNPCGLFCVAPQGPSDPFGNSILIVYDTVRVTSITAAVVAITLAVLLIYRQRRDAAPGQIMRLASMILLLVVAASIPIEHLGDFANWRTVAILLAAAGAAGGNYAGLRWECPPRPRTDRRA